MARRRTLRERFCSALQLLLSALLTPGSWKRYVEASEEERKR